MACTCLLIAGKASENIRHIRDVINVLHAVRYPNAGHLQVIHQDQPYASDEYTEYKQSVINQEQIIMRILAFDLHCELPYVYIVQYCKMLFFDDKDTTCVENVESSRMSRLVRESWTVCNDSFRLTICMHFSATEIAAACIDVAARRINIELPQSSTTDASSSSTSDGAGQHFIWCHVFGVTGERLRTIGDALENMYRHFQS